MGAGSVGKNDAATLEGHVAQAIERVLRAELDAASALEHEAQAARDLLDAARAEALQLVNDAAQRIGQCRQRHAEALAQRLSALREQSLDGAAATRLPDETILAAAIDALSARLTGAVGDEGAP